MRISRRAFGAGTLSLSVAASMPKAVFAEEGALSDGILERSDFWTALDAYIYAYPLVTMEYTRRALTNVVKPVGTKAPMGQIGRLREYPNASFRDVTAPNADTLYTYGFFDVGKEPYVFSLPDMNGRYALFPMLDGWTNVFAVPGKRTTGTGAQTYVVTGPGWKGTLPDGMTEYKCPTNLFWLLGRIYCTGTPEDYAAVHKIQDEISVVPLSAYGKSYTPPAGKIDPSIDMKTPVRDQVNALDAVSFFTLFCELMKDNPRRQQMLPFLSGWRKSALFRARISIQASWMSPFTATFQRSHSPGSCCISRKAMGISRISTGGPTRPKPGFMEPTIFSAL
nr:DUF1254 domain-containing protein [Marinicella sp. W31]MDC2877434.1 DUF1254 domain-containing protein [Marinicella sp. W31]